MTEIKRLHHASLVVGDTERALLFYRDLLGLAVLEERPDMGFPGAWLDIGSGQQIHLLELPNPDPVNGRPQHGGRDRHLALSVRQLNNIEKNLKEANIEYTRSRSGRAALFCRDPDGNALEFIQQKT